MVWAPSVMAGVSCFLALAPVLGAHRERSLRRLVVGQGGTAWRTMRAERRFTAHGIDLLGRAGRMLDQQRAEVLRRRLLLAGDPLPLQVVAGLKIVLALVGLVLCLVGGAFVPVALAMVPVVGWALYRAPDVAAARLARRRQAHLDGQVPDLVEVLVAMAEAGLSPIASFRRSAEVIEGPLGSELAAVARHTELGMPWRQALDELLVRTESPSLKRLAFALSRSARVGTSVGSVLKGVAAELRAVRRTRAEELARRAPVKMLFPLVFLILPAFLLLTVGPVVLATIRSLR